MYIYIYMYIYICIYIYIYICVCVQVVTGTFKRVREQHSSNHSAMLSGDQQV